MSLLSNDLANIGTYYSDHTIIIHRLHTGTIYLPFLDDDEADEYPVDVDYSDDANDEEDDEEVAYGC